ncbi:hypothetical protein HDU98_011668 [Podochytrium sp. JEL0797]|nr:hypothetical protein HDU98_011668 [Podochytrium sp. JEL0797]
MGGILVWLLRWVVFLVIIYYSTKYAFSALLAPVLRPFGIRVGMVGLRSGVTDVVYEARDTSGGGLVSLGIGSARLGVLLTERKAVLQIAGLRVRVVAGAAASKTPPLLAPRDRVERLVAAMARAFKNAGRAVRVVLWVGLLEIDIVGLDLVIVDAANTPLLALQDDKVSLHLQTDIVTPPPNETTTTTTTEKPSVAFAVSVVLAPFACSMGPRDAEQEIVKFHAESRLSVLCDMNSNTHSVSLALPEISVQSVFVLNACIASLKPQHNAANPTPPAVDLGDILQKEYNLRRDYYVSLLRNAFLSTIHDFHPTLKVEIAKLTVNMPPKELSGFDEFDMDVQATTAHLDTAAFTCTLVSKPGSDGERILWVDTTLSAKNLNVDVELREGYKSSIASLPNLSVHLQISVPLMSLTQNNLGIVVLTSNISSLSVVIPSRLFLVLTAFSARQKSLRKADDAVKFEQFQFWPKLFRRHYTPVIDLTLENLFVGFRCGTYNGINDAEDAVLAVSCDNVRTLSEAAVLSTTPLTSSKHSRNSLSSFKILELRLFMTPLHLESFVVNPYNLDSFATQRMAASRNTMAVISESRSLLSVSVSDSNIDIDVQSNFAEFVADLTCLSIPGGLDYFAIATFMAGLLHKVTVVKSTFPMSAPPFPLYITFTLKSPRVILSASENYTCAMTGTATDVVLTGLIDPFLNQTISIDASNVVINAVTEFTKPITYTPSTPTSSSTTSSFPAPPKSTNSLLEEPFVSTTHLGFHFKKIMHPPGHLPSMTIVVPNVDLDFNLRRFFVCFTSYLPVLKMTKIINSRDGAGSTGVDVDATVGVLNLRGEFATTRVEGVMEDLRGVMQGGKVGSGRVKSVRIKTLDKVGEWQEVLGVVSVVVGFEKETEDRVVVDVEAVEAVVTNPSGFEFSDLFEDVINLQKGIKNLIFERMGLVSMARLTAGKTVFKNSEMPEYRVRVGRVLFRILDDVFESKLARNYRASFEEQFGRIARDKAFQKRAVPMRDEANGDVKGGPIEDAYWSIQEFNSKSWIRRISKSSKEFPPLLSATVLNLNVVVTPPTMPCATIEETIHYIDPQTPVELEYDDLIARDVCLSISELRLQLRDFPSPFVHVPQTNSLSTWKTNGLLIIADLKSSLESKRVIDLSLSPVQVAPITVTRNLCPVKIYAQSSTNIKVSEKQPLFLSWGMCMEPPLADMIRVLDSFTKLTLDPSPPVGWWDKMRHMIHLGRTVFHIGDGDFKLRILGSYTPYYDARYHYGTEGIDIAFGNGVNVEFTDRPNENIVIESGQCTFSIPNSIHEAGRICGAHRKEVRDEVFAQFVGGVKIAVGIHFTTFPENSMEEIEIWKSHSDVILKLPEFAQPAYANVVDSYFGFRSKSIHVVYDIQSPFSKYNSSVNGSASNFLSFTNDSFYRFLKLIPVYQSPLAIIPIRRGPLFEKNVSTLQHEKPKLGRSIKSNHLKGSIFPLILSYLCEFEDATGGVGLRFGSQRMDVDLMFEQKCVTIVKEGGEAGEVEESPAAVSVGASSSSSKNTTRWVLQAAEVEFTEVEGRTISFGSERFGSDNKYQSSGVAGGGAVPVDQDRQKWFLEIDFNYVTNHFDMVSFVWSPKVKYFKRSEDSKFESAHKMHTEAEVHKDQIKLYQKRADELQAIIYQYIIQQKALSDRKEIMHDDTVGQDIERIKDKLEGLFEKKNTIERHIRNSLKHVKDYEFNKTETANLNGGSKNQDSMFDHHYVMHNIRFLWKRDVRNICLRFFALLRRESALSYCLSNAALKTVKELLSLSIKQGDKERTRAKTMFDPESGILGDFDSKVTEDLLDQLLNDMDNPAVNHEGDDDRTAKHATNPESSTALADLVSYTSSTDPDSPDYVASNMCVNSSYIVQCINPQVNFESSQKKNPASHHSVVVVAETMQFRSIHILESAINNSIVNIDEEQRQNEDLVKDRTILNIQNAQFFTCTFEAVQKDQSTKPFMYAPSASAAAAIFHRDSVIDEKVAGLHVAAMPTFWPIWVPIENVTWNDFDVDHCLERVVGRTSASVYRDKPNPLYVRRNGSTTKADFTDCYTVDFPDFRTEVNSKQFFYVFDIVQNLLMYHDPASGERSKRLRKMMLALEQMTDLTVVLDSVLVLQDKIRQGSKLLKFGVKMQNNSRLHQQHRHSNNSANATPNNSPTLTQQESDDVRNRLLQFQEEMYVIMESLKALSILEQKKNSLEVALQVQIHAKNLVWTMSQETGQPLAQWSLADSRFMWIQNEDQSSLNTLEINRLHLENLMMGNSASFRNMISPFGDTKNVNFARNKMVRVYWREMAPVAGIKVVDHFEMNIYPLLLQITRDTGKALEKYFFPKDPSTTAAAGTVALDDDETTTIATATTATATTTAADSPEKKTAAAAAVAAAAVVKLKQRSKMMQQQQQQPIDDFKEMQVRAAENRSFVYIKVPTLQLCLSYKGPREKNIEDLNMFTFWMPTMEYRNKTWAWQDFFDALKRDAIKAVIHNSGALVREKLFQKTNTNKNVDNEVAGGAGGGGGGPSTEMALVVGGGGGGVGSAGGGDGHVDDATRKKGLFHLMGSASNTKKKI